MKRRKREEEIKVNKEPKGIYKIVNGREVKKEGSERGRERSERKHSMHILLIKLYPKP
jgi:hypothetical protein